MWHPVATGTQTITVKSEEWNVGGRKSQTVIYNQLLRRNLQSTELCVLYMFITNQYVNREYLFIHGIPQAILEMLAAENDADGCWMRL